MTCSSSSSGSRLSPLSSAAGPRVAQQHTNKYTCLRYVLDLYVQNINLHHLLCPSHENNIGVEFSSTFLDHTFASKKCCKMFLLPLLNSKHLLYKISLWISCYNWPRQCLTLTLPALAAVPLTCGGIVTTASSDRPLYRGGCGGRGSEL